MPWLPCAGSIILRRARGEYRGGRHRDVGAAFLCDLKSACSRGAEGRLPGLGLSCLPCGNCLWGWYLGPAARGGVSCGRCFHTEGAWCAACGLQVKNRPGCTSVPLISGRSEKKKTQGPRNSTGAWRHASVWPFNLHYRVLASFFCIMYYETQKNATLRGEIGSSLLQESWVRCRKTTPGPRGD